MILGEIDAEMAGILWTEFRSRCYGYRSQLPDDLCEGYNICIQLRHLDKQIASGIRRSRSYALMECQVSQNIVTDCLMCQDPLFHKAFRLCKPGLVYSLAVTCRTE